MHYRSRYFIINSRVFNGYFEGKERAWSLSGSDFLQPSPGYCIHTVASKPLRLRRREQLSLIHLYVAEHTFIPYRNNFWQRCCYNSSSLLTKIKLNAGTADIRLTSRRDLRMQWIAVNVYAASSIHFPRKRNQGRHCCHGYTGRYL